MRHFIEINFILYFEKMEVVCKENGENKENQETVKMKFKKFLVNSGLTFRKIFENDDKIKLFVEDSLISDYDREQKIYLVKIFLDIQFKFSEILKKDIDIIRETKISNEEKQELKKFPIISF